MRAVHTKSQLEAQNIEADELSIAPGANVKKQVKF